MDFVSPSNPVAGNGTPNTIPLWLTANTIGDSLLTKSGTTTIASGTLRAIAAATQDAIQFSPRAGGTGSYVYSITTAVQTANQTLTLPAGDVTLTAGTSIAGSIANTQVAVGSGTNTVAGSAALTHSASTGIAVTASSAFSLGLTASSASNATVAGNFPAATLRNLDVTNNNGLALFFQSYDTSSAVRTGAGIGVTFTNKGASSVDGVLAFYTTIGSYAERLRISAAGNLLVGTTADTGITGAGGVSIANTTSASSSTVGAFLVGNGTAATNVAIGGGNVNAGGTLKIGSTTASTGTTTGSIVTAGGIASAANSVLGAKVAIGSSAAIAPYHDLAVTGINTLGCRAIGNGCDLSILSNGQGGGFFSNWYYNAGDKAAYLGYCPKFEMVTSDGSIRLSTTSATVAADAAIGWSERMRINAPGNVLIGTTTDGMTANGSLAINQDLAHRGSKAGFFNVAPVVRPSMAAWTGTATRTTFNTATATLANVAEALKALIDDQRAYGFEA